MEVDGEFVEASADAAALLHPADAWLHDRALFVCDFVKSGAAIVSHLFVVFVRNHRFDAASAQPVANAPHAVSLVCRKFVNTFIRMPVQLIRGGRRMTFRLLSWNPWQAVFLRGVDALRSMRRGAAVEAQCSLKLAASTAKRAASMQTTAKRAAAMPSTVNIASVMQTARRPLRC